MKNILTVIFALAVTLSFTIDNGGMLLENGTLSGVVTCRDAYSLSDQPDMGCEIYAINEADVKSTKYRDLKSVIERFHGYKYDYLLSVYNSIDPARIKRMQDNFDTLSNITGKYIRGFKKLPGIVKAVTNETGNYTLSLKPGKYYLLIISGSLKNNNSAESKGNIGYKIVDIKPNQETTQNAYFQKYEMTGIMLARNLSGC
ncbi:MAG: hypothetical protein WCJ26_06970 [bacterium]